MRWCQFFSTVFLAVSILQLTGCGRRKKRSQPLRSDQVTNVHQTCDGRNQDVCDATRLRIDVLSEERDAAFDSKNMARVASLSLDLNLEEERLRLLVSGQGTPANIERLESKYKALKDVLDQELTRLSPAGSGSNLPSRPSLTGLGLVYDGRESLEVAKVMEQFGDLYVKESGLSPDGTPRWEELQVERPWAGYWFPLASRSLFETDASPLAKLDKLASSRNIKINAAALESTLANLAQEGWEGRCAAWAMASVMSKEPTGPRKIGDITFSIQDQKALLTKLYELYPSRIFGLRYDGDDATDGTLQDIRPEALHRIFLSQLGEKHQPFIIDDASGIEIWSKPLYRMRWTVQPDPDHASAFRVTAQPWVVKHRNFESDAPTSDSDRASPEWTYRLYFDPRDRREDGFRIIAGEWVGPSRNSHPDTITVPIPGKSPQSSNIEINKAINIIKEVLELPH